MKLRRLGAALLAAAALTAIAAPAASAADPLDELRQDIHCWAWLLAGGHC